MNQGTNKLILDICKLSCETSSSANLLDLWFALHHQQQWFCNWTLTDDFISTQDWSFSHSPVTLPKVLVYPSAKQKAFTQVLQSYVEYKHAHRKQPGLWLSPASSKDPFSCNSKLPSCNCLSWNRWSGEILPPYASIGNWIVLYSNPNTGVFFWRKHFHAAFLMQISCKAKEGKSLGGKCLFAMCNQHSQWWQFVCFKGVEMKSKAAREMVKRMVWSQHPE